jgi:hypothetical protein
LSVSLVVNHSLSVIPYVSIFEIMRSFCSAQNNDTSLHFNLIATMTAASLKPRSTTVAPIGVYLCFLCFLLCLHPAQSFSSPPVVHVQASRLLKTTRKQVTSNHQLKLSWRRQPRLIPRHGASAIVANPDESPPNTPAGHPKRRLEFWSQFLLGVEHVRSHFLEFFWKYSVVRSLTVVAPIITLLSIIQALAPSAGASLSSALVKFLSALYFVVLQLSRVLGVPLDALAWIGKSIQTSIIISLDYLPYSSAMSIMMAMLYLSNKVRMLSETAVAIVANFLFWNPMVEEFQYRFLIDTVFTNSRGKKYVDNKNNNEPTTTTSILSANTTSTTSLKKADPVVESSSDSTIIQKDDRPIMRWIIISNLLFATSRLYWLSADTYSMAGFLQSAVAHFSGNSLSELRPFLEKLFLAIALHQSVTAYLLSRNVFAPLYQEGGLAASMGGHVAWTVGVVTLPLRLVAIGIEGLVSLARTRRIKKSG